jgi:hypothetical protein
VAGVLVVRDTKATGNKEFKRSDTALLQYEASFGGPKDYCTIYSPDGFCENAATPDVVRRKAATAAFVKCILLIEKKGSGCGGQRQQQQA